MIEWQTLRTEPAFNFQIAYLASVRADRVGATGLIASPKFPSNHYRGGSLLSNNGEKHHELCRWICCGRSYYQS
jgi:hypothetical protein